MQTLAWDLYCSGSSGVSMTNFWKKDKWIPPLREFHSFETHNMTHEIMENKTVLFAGDSTTRDTFYQFVNVIGHPIFDKFHFDRKKVTYPSSTFGRDKWGRCMGDFTKLHTCTRVVHTPTADVHFEFLMRASSAFELDHLDKIQDVTDAFVQCPIFEWLSPNAYDTNASKKNRTTVVNLAPTVIGSACAVFFQHIKNKWPNANLFLLGPTPPPGWVQKSIKTSSIFRSINEALNISCTRRDSRIFPIDRYTIVQNRTRDRIHPHMYAQHAIVNLILNLLL